MKEYIICYLIPVYRNGIMYYKYEYFRSFPSLDDAKEFAIKNKIEAICRYEIFDNYQYGQFKNKLHRGLLEYTGGRRMSNTLLQTKEKFYTFHKDCIINDIPIGQHLYDEFMQNKSILSEIDTIRKEAYKQGMRDCYKQIEDIKAEIEQMKEKAEIDYGHQLGFDKIYTYNKCLEIINNYIRKEEKNE